MIQYDVLGTFVGATAALAISPGPDNLYVLTQSIANGKREGFLTVCGLISGCLVHTTLLAVGLSSLIQANTHILFGIKLFGALYLGFLAYRVFRSDASLNLRNTPKKASMGRIFGQGFLMNVLNPKVTIFFLAFFPGFLFSTTLTIAIQFYLLGLLFMAVSFFIFTTIVMLSDTIATHVIDRNSVGTALKWLQIIVFTGLAFYLLLSEK